MNILFSGSEPRTPDRSLPARSGRHHATGAVAEGVDGLFPRLCRAAALDPVAVALVVDDDAWSYAALLDAVGQCATRLADLGCNPGDAVVLLFPNSVEFVVAAFATFAIGGVLVPLNPGFRAEEIQHTIDATRPRAIFCPVALLPTVEPVTPDEAVILTAAIDPGRPFAATARTFAGGRGDAAAVYMFSSGSTGKSKRITRTHAQIVAEYDALTATVGLGRAERILCTIPLYHAHGFANAMMAALLSGGRLVLLPREFNARATMRAIEQHAITMLPSVPFMVQMIAEARFAQRPDVASLRLVFTAGAPLPDAVGRRFHEQFGRPVSQLYGSTETGAICINVRHPLDKPASVGRPLAGTAVSIRDDQGQVLPAGSEGEVWIESTTMTRQYDGLDALTRESFVDDRFTAGDLGRIDADGDLFITGRKKLLINVAGYKVDPLEVEDVLRNHAAVEEAVVLGVADPQYGELVKAVIVCREGVSCTGSELADHVAAVLAAYKVPKRFEFRTEIPRSPLGKVLRKYLQ